MEATNMPKTLFNKVKELAGAHTLAVAPPLNTQQCQALACFFTDKIDKIILDINANYEELSPSSDSELTLSCANILDSWPALSADKLKVILKTIKSGSPRDPIPIKIIKLLDDSSLEIIANLLNSSLDLATVPTLWKHAMVAPLLKKPTANPEILANYRPISLLPAFSKCLERHVHSVLSTFAEDNSLLHPSQSGFRAGFSTETALLGVTEYIRKLLDQGEAEEQLLNPKTLRSFEGQKRRQTDGHFCPQVSISVIHMFLKMCTWSQTAANRCDQWGHWEKEQYAKEGDVMIGGVFTVNQYFESQPQNFMEPPNRAKEVCLMLISKYYRHFLAFQFAINEINNNPHLLPNITLGFTVYDSCRQEDKATESVIRILSMATNPVPNYTCAKNSQLAGVIGDLGSITSIPMAQLLGIYGYAQISYGATDPLLSDRNQFPTFFRSVPDELSQHAGIAELLVHMGWTWVGIVASHDDDGEQESEELEAVMTKYGICVEFTEMVSSMPQMVTKNEQSAMVISRSSTNIIVLCGSSSALFLFLHTQLVPVHVGKVFIMPEKWNLYASLGTLFPSPFSGSLLFGFRHGEIRGLREFLQGIHISNRPEDIFISDFWVMSFHCAPLSLSGFKKEMYDLLFDGPLSNCTGKEDVKTLPASQYDLYNFRTSYATYQAVYAMAHALHEMYGKRSKMDPPERNMEYELKKKLPTYIKNIRFQNTVGEEVFFDDKGNSPPVYDIINNIELTDGTRMATTVGTFDASAPEGKRLLIDRSAIVWPSRFHQEPRSTCSESCQPGYRKVIRPGAAICCYDCVLCSHGEISNKSDMDDCMKCPDDQWPNEKKIQCVQKVIVFLSHDEPLGIALMSTALVCSLGTILILVVIFSYRHTPIVKANNRDLSFVILLSLLLSFLCSLMFIGRPGKVSCVLRQVAFVVSFSVSISSILAKTITVVLAFQAAKPGHHLRKWMGRRVTSSVVVFGSTTQVTLCCAWLTTSPPFPFYDMQAEFGQIVLDCKEGSVLAFYSVIGYLGFLATVSFVLAFLARNLPDSFNEAKFITFSMLVFCSVWLSFIPTYLSTKGKYSVAVEMFAILASSSGLLGCIFGPKCYIILLRPERNNRRQLMTKRIAKKRGT
ncbi:vomeronasal type-2 receptor 26-like [Lissotriton helveticus]